MPDQEETKPTRPSVLEEVRATVQQGVEATHMKHRVSADLTVFTAKQMHSVVLVEGRNFRYREVGSQQWADGQDERERNVRDLVLITGIQDIGNSLMFTALSLSTVNRYGESREWRFNLSEITRYEIQPDFMAGLRDLAKAVLGEPQLVDESDVEPAMA